MNDLICLSVPNFCGNERKYVDEAIDTEWVSTAGQFIGQFEEKMAVELDVAKACACQSGSAGLHLCLRHFEIGPGDLVLVPTLTFIATINAVMYQSAEPVFFDCDNHMCINVDQIEQYLTYECRLDGIQTIEIASDKVVKAIIPVHVFGDLCDMERLMQIAERYHLYVIEDATESLGGTFQRGPYVGKCPGTVGHAGVLSFNGNKIITTSGGGMLLVQTEDAEERAKKVLFWSTQARDAARWYQHSEIGYNYRMSNVVAGIGRGQLKVLDQRVEKKRYIFEYYKK